MRKSFVVTLIVVLLGITNSLFAVDQDAKIEKLERRIAKLEKALKPIFAQQKAKENIKKLQAQARTRMQADLKTYSRKQLSEIEALYKSRGQKWKIKQKNLELLIAKFPKANRAGCAMLYLGRSNKGAIQEKKLKQAIEEYSDCFYGDGTQVGPYAKFCLAMAYLKSKKKVQAVALFNEIKTKFPDAINHRGRNLASIIKNIKIK